MRSGILTWCGLLLLVAPVVPAMAQDGDDKAIIRQRREAAAAFAKGEKWAVLIGVNDYSDGRISDLRYCVDDARLLAKTLSTRCGYPEENILLITDDQEKAHLRPSKVAMQQQVGAWLKLAEPDDTVFVFFSGHGFLDDRGQGFLATQNADTDSLGLTALRTDDLRDMLRQCKAKQKLLVLDCCHSGGEKSIEQLGPSSEELSRSFRDAGGLITLASCGKKEKSHEWEKVGQGLFTYYLADGLQGKADYDGDSLVSSDELYRYTHANVPKSALRIFGGKQQPRRIIGEDVVGVFALARVDANADPLVIGKQETDQPTGDIPAGISVGEGLKVARWLTMRPVTQFTPEDNITIVNAKVSADGSRVIFAAHQGTYVLNLEAEGAKPVQVSKEKNDFAGGMIDISADGETIAWVDKDGAFTANSDGTKKRKMPFGAAGDIYSLRLTADGKSLFMISYHARAIMRMPSDGQNLAKIVTIEQTQKLVESPGTFSGGTNLDINDDGTRLVFYCGRDIFAADGDGKNLRAITDLGAARPAGYASQARISGDGSTIAYLTPYGKDAGSLHFVNWEGKPLSKHAEAKNSVWLQLSHDGSQASVSWSLRTYRRDGKGWRDPINFKQNYLPATFRARAATCTADFRRAVIIADQAVGREKANTQLVVVDFNPPKIDGMPTVEDVVISPRFLLRDGSTKVGLTAKSEGDRPQMFLCVQRDGRFDHRYTYYGALVLSDEGKTGDEEAYDGTYTHSDIRMYKDGDKAAPAGPLTFRVCAFDKHHRLLAVDIEGVNAN